MYYFLLSFDQFITSSISNTSQSQLTLAFTDSIM